MLLHILAQTPRWVFVLFAGLLWLGISQMLTRNVKLGRVTGIAIGMMLFSLYGTFSAFGGVPLALLGWLGGAALVFGWLSKRRAPAGTIYDTASRRFTIPGSALPLALMMGIFFTKYAVAVAIARSPALAAHLPFALATSVLYGVFSGAFAGRAARLWRLALARDRADDTVSSPVAA